MENPGLGRGSVTLQVTWRGRPKSSHANTCERKEVTFGRGQNTTMGGSDPILDGLEPPKICWGRSRPPRMLRDRVLPTCKSQRMQFVMHFVVHQETQKGGKHLAILKAPSKQPKTTTLQVRLTEEVRHSLDKYAEFLDANASYVVSEGLKFLFKRDKEFKCWLDQHNNAGTLPHTHKHAISKGESIQLELK